MPSSNTGGTRRTALNKGVKVCQEIHRDGRDIVCTLEIQSQRDETVLVRINDELPTELPVEEFGFEDESQLKRATVTSDGVLIVKTVDDDPVEVVYGIKLSSPVTDIDPAPPTVRSVEEVSLTRGASTQADDGDAPSEQSVEEGAADEDRADTDESGESAASIDDATAVGDGGTDSAATAEPTQDAASDADPNTCSDDVRSPAVSDGAESADGAGSLPSRNVGVRLDHLSARVEEFAGYAGALEEIINEHGTASEVIDRFERDIAELETRLDSTIDEITDLAETHDADIADIDETTTRLEDRVDSVGNTLDSEIAGVRSDLDDVEETVDAVGTTTRRLEANVDEQESDIATVSSEVDSLDDRVHGVATQLDELRDTVGSVESDLTTVRNEVEGTRDELAALRDEVRELHEFRDNLASVFAGDVDLATAEAAESTPSSDGDS